MCSAEYFPFREKKCSAKKQYWDGWSPEEAVITAEREGASASSGGKDEFWPSCFFTHATCSSRFRKPQWVCIFGSCAPTRSLRASLKATDIALNKQFPSGGTSMSSSHSLGTLMPPALPAPMPLPIIRFRLDHEGAASSRKKLCKAGQSGVKCPTSSQNLREIDPGQR